MSSIPRKFDNLSTHKKNCIFDAICALVCLWLLMPVMAQIVLGIGIWARLSVLFCWGLPFALFVCVAGAKMIVVLGIGVRIVWRDLLRGE